MMVIREHLCGYSTESAIITNYFGLLVPESKEDSTSCGSFRSDCISCHVSEFPNIAVAQQSQAASCLLIAIEKVL